MRPVPLEAPVGRRKVEMYHEIEEPECSACGAKNSETFQRQGINGRRCLVCGHEQVANTTTTQNNDAAPMIWTSSHTRPQF